MSYEETSEGWIQVGSQS